MEFDVEHQGCIYRVSFDGARAVAHGTANVDSLVGARIGSHQIRIFSGAWDTAARSIVVDRKSDLGMSIAPLAERVAAEIARLHGDNEKRQLPLFGGA